MAKIMMRGDLLPLDLQREALSSYVHRFTRQHVPAWARQPMPNGNAYPVQYDSDAQWLARTLFPVIRRGDRVTRLAAGDCYLHPYWPDGVPDGMTRRETIERELDL
jgi:hypothetical protein